MLFRSSLNLYTEEFDRSRSQETSKFIRIRKRNKDVDKTILPSSGVSQLPVDGVEDCAKQDTVL